MVEPKEIEPKKPEQAPKTITKEKIKKERLIEKFITKEFYLNHKRLLVFLIIGLLLIIGIYYACDKLQSSVPGEQQTGPDKEENGEEVAPSEGENGEDGEEEKEDGEEEGEEAEEEEGEEAEEEEGETETGEEGGEEAGEGGEEGEEWSYEPGPNDYLFESVGAEKIIESVRIRLNRVESDTPKNFAVLEVGDILREKIEMGETRVIEGLSITLLEAHPGGTPLESYAKLRIEKS